MTEFNVLSLFDGMSCGLQALKNIGIQPTNYFASEIDPHAITIAKKNHPEIIHIGDVTRVVAENGGLHYNGRFYRIHLIIGGSPCQGFSFAGKQLNFEDPRSKLFFEFVRLKNELSPEFFLLENVKMKQAYQDVITQYLAVKPVRINSALVSAQNRTRLYWSNLPITQPEDKQIYLKDILDPAEPFPVLYLRGRGTNSGGLRGIDGKTPAMTSNSWEQNVFVVSLPEELDPDGLIFLAGLMKGLRLKDGKFLSRNFREGSRIYDIAGKSATLTAASKGGDGGYSGLYGFIEDGNLRYRKLTPVECERLQTVPDSYTEGVSTTQRYRMLGNGWTVKVIEHIFKGLQKY